FLPRPKPVPPARFAAAATRCYPTPISITSATRAPRWVPSSPALRWIRRSSYPEAPSINARQALPRLPPSSGLEERMMNSPMNVDSQETRPLWALNATELVSGYLAQRFTPLDVIESVLERTDGVNLLVNAVVTSDREGARRAAAEPPRRHG